MTDKLYVIVRTDLRAGQQAVQAAHALRQFVEEHPETERAWFRRSNTLAMLAVPDEEALRCLLARADDRGIRTSIFREPDIDNQLTAIVLEPNERARRLCKGMPLALQDP